MKWKITDGGSAMVVKEQVFLSRYKSESGIVESSVSKSSACCQYCHSCLWSVAKNKILQLFSHFPNKYFFLKCTIICI